LALQKEVDGDVVKGLIGWLDENDIDWLILTKDFKDSKGNSGTFAKRLLSETTKLNVFIGKN